jgi:hypothetical protein
MSWNITNAVIFMCAREENGRIPGFLDNYTIGTMPHGSGLQNLDGSNIPRPYCELLMEI